MLYYTLHCIALRYIALRCIVLHCIAFVYAARALRRRRAQGARGRRLQAAQLGRAHPRVRNAV